MSLQCGHLNLINIAFNSLISALIIGSSIPSMRSMVKHHREKRKFSPLLFRTQIVFYGLCIFYGFVRIPDIVIECEHLGLLYDVFFPLAVLSYAGHWITFLLILFLRLIQVFHQTDQETTSCFRAFSLCIMALLSLNFIAISVIFTVFRENAHLSLVTLCSMVILSAAMALFLMITFIRKLYVLNANISAAANSSDLIEIMTKYAILTGISLLVTAASLLLVIALEYDGSESVINMIITATTTNVLIDILCISLSFKFYEKYYKLCCRCTDTRCRSCCRCLTHRRDAMLDEAQLAQTIEAPRAAPRVVSVERERERDTEMEMAATTQMETATI